MPAFICAARQRYNYYVNEAIDVSMLAPMPSTQMANVLCRIPKCLLTNPELEPTLKLLEEEVYEYYLYSLRKGIGKPANVLRIFSVYTLDVRQAANHWFTR